MNMSNLTFISQAIQHLAVMANLLHQLAPIQCDILSNIFIYVRCMYTLHTTSIYYIICNIFSTN